MQIDAAGSYSGVTDDGNSSNSLGYLDSVNKQFQNHVMPGFPSSSASLREAMINITRGGTADELWSIQPGKDSTCSIEDMEGISPQVGAYETFENHKIATSASLMYPFESPETVITGNSSNVNSTLDSTSYIFEGLPFVGGVNGRAGVLPFQPTGNSVLNGWILSEQEDLSSHNLGPSRCSKKLSLSLATSRPSVVHGTSIQKQWSEMSSSVVTNYLQKISENTSCSSSNKSNSYKPLQLSPLLSGSRFFHAMQEILAEIACFALENFDQMNYSATGIDNNVSFSSSCTPARTCSTIGFYGGHDADNRFMFQNNLLHEREVESKKKHLLFLLKTVDDQYNRCLDEIHTVISAFHAVTELDPNLHARFALPVISLMYRNLRERISSHILTMGAHLREEGATEDNSFETYSFETSFIQQLKKRDHQLWRPQRGLPERSVSVLRAWMFQNFLHPYPKDSEKHLLALKSGLTRSQVSNWFINARVRLWKPMIEEMYAEMNRRKARGNEGETIVDPRNHMLFENRRFTMD